MQRKIISYLSFFLLSASAYAQEVSPVVPHPRGMFSQDGNSLSQQLPLSVRPQAMRDAVIQEESFGELKNARLEKRFFQNDIVIEQNPPLTKLLVDSLTRSAPKSSRGKVFLRSFLIPGWGQKSVGAKTSARNFFVAELTLWAGYVAFQVRGHWLKDDYRLFGKTHAGFNPAGKADRFFVDAGNFNSVDDYNQARLRDRNAAALYDPATHFWRWDSEANRLRYATLRVRSESAYSNSAFVIAGVLANHVISGIHALYLARRQENLQKQGTLPSPQFFVESSPRDIRLVARLEF